MRFDVGYVERLEKEIAELKKPPTETEIAELSILLTQDGKNILRRLAFQNGQLKEEIAELEKNEEVMADAQCLLMDENAKLKEALERIIKTCANNVEVAVVHPIWNIAEKALKQPEQEKIDKLQNKPELTEEDRYGFCE